MTGRITQVSRVGNLLGDRCNVALHAAPGVGKTWLADQVISHLGGESEKVVRVDVSVHADAAAVLHAVHNRIGGEAVERTSVVRGAWNALREELTRRASPCIVVLDEFDEVLRFPDALEFLKLLRELIHRPAVTKCAVLILSRRSLETIESQVRGISTLATICYPEYLGGVTNSDLTEVWGLTEEVAESALAECIAWSGGYAPLVRYWLALHPHGPEGSQGEHQQVLEFERLLDYLELINLLNAAAQLVIGPVVDDWLREVRQLQALGVLDGPSAKGYASHDVFVACLRRRTVALDPWGPLGLAELRLRGVIDDVFSTTIGPEWPDKLAKGNRAVSSALCAAREKQVVDERRFGKAADWLAYTYPQDLGNIIISHWASFQEVFGPGSREQWRERFQTLAQYRTPVAHNRAEVLSEAQRLQCRAYADEVLRAVDRHIPG